MVNQALAELSGEFQAMYSREGRPSIPPEKLLRALLLQVFYTIRSARLLMEQLDYNLLFRWFVGLSMDDKVWDHSVFSKNQERFLRSDLAAAFFGRIKEQAAQAGLLSDEHFTVDGTLIEAWASLKSFRPKDAPPPSGGSGRNPEVDFHGERRLNHPRLYHRPGGAAFPQGQRQRGQALFHGACADGEPPRSDHHSQPYRGYRNRRAGRGRAYGWGLSWPTSHYRGW
jgi:transposase